MKSSKFPKAVIAAVMIAVAGAANAQIPVTDLAHITTSIANQVETIAKWAQQYQQIQQQIQQAQQHYASIVGARGMAQLLDNSRITAAIPSNWDAIVSSLRSSAAYKAERARFPKFDTLPKSNYAYDIIATQNVVTADLYKKANDRLALVKQLTLAIDSAADPAAKSDLANRLISEQNAIQANINLVTLLKEKHLQELEVASAAAEQEYACREFRRKAC